MSSSTLVKVTADEELTKELLIAYDDLRYMTARIMSLRMRLDPTETKREALRHVTRHIKRKSVDIMEAANLA